jgi:hypothetical protein
VSLALGTRELEVGCGGARRVRLRYGAPRGRAAPVRWAEGEFEVARFAEHADVAASMNETFDYVTDQHKVAEWNEHVQRAEVVGGGPVGVGARLRQHRRRGNRDFDLTFQVTAHEPPRRHTVTGQVFGVDTTMDFNVAEHGAGPRVTMTATVTGKGLRGVLAPIVAREMRKSTKVALAALRQRLGAAS